MWIKGGEGRRGEGKRRKEEGGKKKRRNLLLLMELKPSVNESCIWH